MNETVMLDEKLNQLFKTFTIKNKGNDRQTDRQITIITCTWNSEKYLQKCIESVKNQL